MSIRRVMFMGANGFPAKVYSPMMGYLEDRVSAKVMGVDYHQHLKLGETRDWQDAVDWTVEAAAIEGEREGGRDGVVGVGHSAGGALMCCAASKAPDIFEKVIIVDSPMFNPMKRAMFAFGSLLPDMIIDKVHPLVKGALAKKHTWKNKKEAEEYYRSRRLYQKFPEETIQSFLEHGLKEDGGGEVGLEFSHLSEACMYKTTPFETPVLGSKNGYMGQYDATAQKGVFLTSKRHDFLDKRDVEFLKDRFGREGGGGFTFEQFEEGHFWPLIDPQGFAEVVARHV